MRDGIILIPITGYSSTQNNNMKTRYDRRSGIIIDNHTTTIPNRLEHVFVHIAYLITHETNQSFNKFN